MDALKTRLELDGSKNFIKKMENITDIDDFANDITIQLYQLHEIQNIIELKHSYQLKCITFRIKYKRGNRILQKAKKMTFQIGKYYTNMDDLMRELEYMHSIFIAKGI